MSFSIRYLMKIIKSMLILAIIALTNIGYAKNTNTLNLKKVKYNIERQGSKNDINLVY